MGLMHAAGTARAIRDYIESPVGLALAHDAMTESRLVPWCTSTVRGDRVRRLKLPSHSWSAAFTSPRPEWRTRRGNDVRRHTFACGPRDRVTPGLA